MTQLQHRLAETFARVERTEADLEDYQGVGKDFLYENPFSALFLDTGLGKTATILALVSDLLRREEAQNVLVIGPTRVVNVTWPDEMAIWSFSCYLRPTIIRDDAVAEAVRQAGQYARVEAKRLGHSTEVIKALVEDARRKEARRLLTAMMVDRAADVYLISAGSIPFLVDAFGKDWPFDTVIYDESSGLKDHTTARWKALWKVRKLIKRMHQSTATPSAESYAHLWGQITLLDNGERLGNSYAKFIARYFTQNQYSRKVEIREGAKEEIIEKISDICLVMKQEDYLDLEQPRTVRHPIKLSAKALALYQEMEREFVVELPEGTVVEAETAAALSQKLLQMASGVLYQTVSDEVAPDEFRKRRVVHEIHREKIDYIRQLETEIEGENMLIAYYHNSSRDRLLAEFPDAVEMDKAGKLIAKWNKGKIKKLLLHPQSNAHGLNLQFGGRHVVFYDLPWSYENYYQLYRRLARKGQKFLVLIHQLVAVGTMDEIVAEALKSKGGMQDELFKWIKQVRARLLRARRDRAVRLTVDTDDEL